MWRRTAAQRARQEPAEDEIARGIAPFAGWAVNTRCLEGFDAANAPVKPIDRRSTPVADVRRSFERNSGEGPPESRRPARSDA